jgi:muconate cycloisomerase
MTKRRNFLKAGLIGAPLMAAPANRIVEKGTLIRKVDVLPTSVPFQKTFVIGRGQVGAQGQGGRYAYVRVESEDGHVGWGETNTVPNWSYETLESVVSTARNYLAPIIMNRSPFDHAYFQKAFDDKLTPAVSHGFPFAKSAVIGAVFDLAGQISGVPIHRFFGGKIHDKIDLCYALSIDTPEEMAKAAASYPYVKCFKLKVAGDANMDTKRIRAVLEARPTADIWLDANQSYRPIQLEQFYKKIENIEQIKCLEQPVKSIDWFGMKRARDRSALPIALDEGCFTSYDVARLARMEAGDLVVLKVAKSGGLWQCYRSVAVADSHGLGLLGSGLTESGIGLIAAIHLYSTLDLLLPPELNGPEFLGDLMVDDLKIEGATVTVPDGPGLGVRVKEDKIRANPIKV